MNNKDDIKVKVLVALGSAIIVAALLGLIVGYNQLVYSDWTCTFKHCVVIKD